MKRSPFSFLQVTILLLLLMMTACVNQEQASENQASESGTEQVSTDPRLAPPTPDTGGLPENNVIFGYEGIGFTHSGVFILGANGTKLPAYTNFAPFNTRGGQMYEEIPDFTEIVLETPSGIARIGVQPIRKVEGQFFPSYDHLDLQRFGSIDNDVRNQAGAVEIGIVPVKLSYHTFTNGNGRSYLTFSPTTDPAAPLTNDRLTYIFEGTTNNGQHLIWAEFPVNTTLLDEIDPTTTVQTVLDQLDDLPSDLFTPDLALLDAMMASLQITPVETFAHTFSTAATDPGTLVVTFAETAVSTPPDVYAINLTTDQYYTSQMPMSSGINSLEFSVPPGNYWVYAHSTLPNDDTFYGYWRSDNIALQTFSVPSGQTVTEPILTLPDDPCRQTIPATPDKKYEATDGDYYQTRFGCHPAVEPGASGTYTVKEGDTLFSIAQAHGANWEQLALVNGIFWPYTITPGQTLVIPSQ
jgi:hypothetical protein